MLGPTPEVELSYEDYAKNNLPDVLARWEARYDELGRARTEQSFMVPKAEIVATDYDLSLNRYKEVEHEEVEYAAPKELIAELRAIEADITKGLDALEEMLG